MILAFTTSSASNIDILVNRDSRDTSKARNGAFYLKKIAAAAKTETVEIQRLDYSSITIRNIDTGASSCTISVSVADDFTEVEIYKVKLSDGQQAIFNGITWTVYTVDGVPLHDDI